MTISVLNRKCQEHTENRSLSTPETTPHQKAQESRERELEVADAGMFFCLATHIAWFPVKKGPEMAWLVPRTTTLVVFGLWVRVPTSDPLDQRPF